MSKNDFYTGYDIREAVIPKKKGGKLEQDFVAFHFANKQIWKLFARFTIDILRRGLYHYSADAVLHRIRWHTEIESVGDNYKINNNYSALYARVFHFTYPEYKGFFRTRRRPSRSKGSK